MKAIPRVAYPRSNVRPKIELTEDQKESKKFLDSKRWKTLRRMHLREFPLCKMCEELGIIRVGQEVDHIESRRKKPGRALDPTNLQTLCPRCHQRKTMREIKERNQS